MNYYILPKSNTPIYLHFSFFKDFVDRKDCVDSKDEINTNIINHNNRINLNIISHTLVYSLLYIKNHILSYDETEIKELSKFINPYEFIFCNVPETNLSISKLNPYSNIYYELMEIIQNMFIFESPFFNKNLNILHLGNNVLSTDLLIDTIRDKYNDNKFLYSFNSFDINQHTIYDFAIFECVDNQTVNLITSLQIIIHYLRIHGTVIIKIDSLFDKVTIDFLFIMTNIFTQVYLIKPLLSNILTNDKYIICSKYLGNHNISYINKPAFEKNVENVSSILYTKIPLFFLSKIEEFNAIYGQQQLEAYDHLINIMNNKNKNDKIEILKKLNIQKSISWCEKYHVPCNKFVDKINMFMIASKQECEDVYQNDGYK